MMLGALAAATGALAVMLSAHLANHLPNVDLVRFGQIQTIHAMATISCATFINAGAVHARRAPPFFLGGILLVAIAAGLSVGRASAAQLFGLTGALALVLGWLLLIASTKDIGSIKK
ncbi:hypothetical protein CHU93_00865 [Sandarakinorhabdus cyanobacteriorum]|uniref:DUF423 domain-containing protein n=1 Tax=Sandarakinorhabdus cyanobacteriorum TaxID=1981098 RepID=A0A255Z5M6_9SPHN|nr:hypothetical protein [Sandarakinorhabdus cyanobacteriorum]OYQ36749.1 hypothetical protein CHU93_00865 [Sandarakinorhabdus cyanobacteriorum]